MEKYVTFVISLFPHCRIWLPVTITNHPFSAFSWLQYGEIRDSYKLSFCLTAEYDCPWKYKLSLFHFFLTAVRRNTWQLQTFFSPDYRLWLPVTITNYPFSGFFLTAIWRNNYVTVTNNPPHFYFFVLTVVARCTWQLEWREIFTAVAVEDAREVLSIKGCTLRTPHRVLNVFALHRLNAVEKLPAVVTVFENAATQRGATLRGEVDYLSLGCRSWKRNAEC